MPAPSLNPIDLDEILPFVTSERILDAISLAYSGRANPRNNENDYYPPWDLTLSDVTNFRCGSTLICRGQCDLWLSAAILATAVLEAEAQGNVADGFSDVDESELGNDQPPHNMTASVDNDSNGSESDREDVEGQ